jgi:hypothetical protein
MLPTLEPFAVERRVVLRISLVPKRACRCDGIQ